MERFKLEVAYSPDLYKYCEQENSIVVVIDVLRATSAICAAFEHGVDKIIPVASIDDAKKYKSKGYLVGAERNGIPIEGFDFGNSPYSYKSEEIKGKEVVLTTTNGTKAIEMAKDADMLVVGSFTNLTSLSTWLLSQPKNIVLLCAGWKGMFNLEDSMFAGAVVNNLYNSDRKWDMSDAGLSAKYLYQMAKNDPIKFLAKASHKRRLHRLNLKQDIKYSLSFDQTEIIPILKNGKLERLQIHEHSAA